MKAPLLAPPDLIKQNEEFSFEGVVINNYRIGERGKLLVKYESVIPVITEKQLLLNPGDVINISGKISEYKGERQVTANRIFKNS